MTCERTLFLCIKGWPEPDEFANALLSTMKKTFISLLLLALAGVLAVPTIGAQEAAKEKKPTKTDLKKYDTNKDGKLDADETAAMKAEKEKLKAEKKAKKDAKEKTEPEAAK